MQEADKKRAIEFGSTEFRPTMDPHALNVERNGVRIGSLQWHPDKSPRIVFDVDSPLLVVPINLLEDIVEKSHEIKKIK
jgi:hypothetical protein